MNSNYHHPGDYSPRYHDHGYHGHGYHGHGYHGHWQHGHHPDYIGHSPHPGYGMPPGGTAVYPPTVPAELAEPQTPFFNLTNPRFIKGALVGAAAAYVLTNETVQQMAIKAAVKSWMAVQGGLEEVKERFRDVEAELHAADIRE